MLLYHLYHANTAAAAHQLSHFRTSLVHLRSTMQELVTGASGDTLTRLVLICHHLFKYYVLQFPEILYQGVVL